MESRMSENTVPSTKADPKQSAPTSEPAGSPMKLFMVLGLLLLAVLIYGALDH